MLLDLTNRFFHCLLISKAQNRYPQVTEPATSPFFSARLVAIARFPLLIF